MKEGGALQAREERWLRKRELLSRFAAADPRADSAASGARPLSLASLTLRMPSRLRLSHAHDSLALELLASFLRELATASIPLIHEEYLVSADGPEALILASAPAERLKRLAIAWEVSEPRGALADLDIMDPLGKPLSRSELGYPSRTCLVCGEEAAVCSAGLRHSAAELDAAIASILARGLEPESPLPSPSEIGRLALTAALYEASAFPKPGLVDPISRGAHEDMDFWTFLSSCAALGPWFTEAARLGSIHQGKPASLLAPLRAEGKKAEAAMFSATGGVNTHKGLVFSLGLLCAAAGRLSARGARLLPQAVCSEAARIAAGIVCSDLGAARSSPERPAFSADAPQTPRITTGARLYAEKGIRGIRGEAEDGFPSVLGLGVPTLRSSLRAGLGMNEAMIDALLSLCASVEDTTVLGRRGEEGLAILRSKAQEALGLGGASTPAGRSMIEDMDRLFSRESISPGGCADLLALSIFLHLLDGSRA